MEFEPSRRTLSSVYSQSKAGGDLPRLVQGAMCSFQKYAGFLVLVRGLMKALSSTSFKRPEMRIWHCFSGPWEHGFYTQSVKGL